MIYRTPDQSLRLCEDGKDTIHMCMVYGNKCFVYLVQIPKKVINQQYNSTQINKLTGAFELALVRWLFQHQIITRSHCITLTHVSMV